MLVRRELQFSGNDLITVYRPWTFDELVGNTSIKNSFKNYLSKGKLPHTLLLSGPSGCGKTTAARIIACTLNCTDLQNGCDPCLKCQSCVATIGGNNFNVSEINVGKDSGKNEVAAATANLSLAPLNARAKIVIFDEAHLLSPAAKGSLLKIMEDSFSHVYIIFCTNEPEKLKVSGSDDNPFIDRCTHFNFGLLSDEEIYTIVENVAFFEGVDPTEDIISYLVDRSEGVPRKALKDLDKVMIEGSWDIETVKTLFMGSSVQDDPKILAVSSAILKKDWFSANTQLAVCLRHHAPESIRIAVAGYLVGCLKRNKQIDKRLAATIDIMTEPLMYDSKTAQHKLYNMIHKAVSAMLTD